MKVKIKRINKYATIPTLGTEKAAGYDLYAGMNNSSIIIKAGETEKIGTGLCIEIPDGYYGAIYARSGLATKRGLRPANCVGIIDSDYRGEIIVALHNDSLINQTIYNEDRIAQLIIKPYPYIVFEEVEELSSTQRGLGGFGSTDK